MLLPVSSGALVDYKLSAEPLVPRPPRTPFKRIALAAAHVVPDPATGHDPWLGPPAMDWDSTLRVRHWLWDQGLGLAEAMDTAQRGMGLDWPTAEELIRRTMAEAKSRPLAPLVACGAGTDHMPPDRLRDEAAITAAYETQIETIEDAGGQVILMATRALPAIGASAEVYERVYGRLLSQAQAPLILHWLGDMFDPALKGYWGSTDAATAADTVLAIIKANIPKVDGIKISLLDQSHEETFRKRLPGNVRLYTGDDFNYADLIAGDGKHYSHALLGIFTAIAPAASRALEAQAQGDMDAYHALLGPTIPLSREIFRAPTQFYKAGIAFLSWLNGIQPHFIMPAGLQSSRGICHYAEVFRLADKARLLMRPELAAARMSALLYLHGIGPE